MSPHADRAPRSPRPALAGLERGESKGLKVNRMPLGVPAGVSSPEGQTLRQGWPHVVTTGARAPIPAHRCAPTTRDTCDCISQGLGVRHGARLPGTVTGWVLLSSVPAASPPARPRRAGLTGPSGARAPPSFWADARGNCTSHCVVLFRRVKNTSVHCCPIWISLKSPLAYQHSRFTSRAKISATEAPGIVRPRGS